MRVTSTPSLLMAGLSVSSVAFAAPTGYGRSPDPSHSEASPLLGSERSPVVRSAERMETFMATPPGFRRRDAAAYGALPRRQLPSAAGLPSTDGITGFAQGLPVNTGTLNSIGTIGSTRAGGAPGVIGSAQGLTQGGLTTDVQGAASNGMGLGNGLGLGSLLPPVVTGTVGGLLNTVGGLLPIGSVIQTTSGLPVVGSLPLSSIGAQLESPMFTPNAAIESAYGYMDALPAGPTVPGLSSITSVPGGLGSGLPLGAVNPGMAALQSIAQQATGSLTAGTSGIPVVGGQTGGLPGQAGATTQSLTNGMGLGTSSLPASGLPSVPSASQAGLPGGLSAQDILNGGLPSSIPSAGIIDSAPSALQAGPLGALSASSGNIPSPEKLASAASAFPDVVAAIQSASTVAPANVGSPVPGIGSAPLAAQAIPTTALPLAPASVPSSLASIAANAPSAPSAAPVAESLPSKASSIAASGSSVAMSSSLPTSPASSAPSSLPTSTSAAPSDTSSTLLSALNPASTTAPGPMHGASI